MTNFKKLLLTGTAVVAMGAAPAFAQTAVDITGDGIWSGDATQDDDGTLPEAAAGADAEFSADATVTFTNDGTADDGSGDTNTFEAGDITDAADATGNIAVTTGGLNPLDVTIGSANIDGNFTVTGDAADDEAITVTLTNASSLGGNLVLDNSAADDDDAISLTASALTVDGTTTVEAGTTAGTNATLATTGTSTFTGLVTLTGGGHADADAIANVSGNTTFTGGVTLDDATGQAIVNADTITDGTDITITGTIDGDAAGAGTLNITDSDATTADSVTFADNIGENFALLAVNVGDGTGNEGGNAVFNGNVSATTITVGAADTGDENVTADFNGDVSGTTLSIVGDSSAATTTVTVAGDLSATDTDLTDGNTDVSLTFDGTSAQAVSSNIEGASPGEGEIYVGTSSVASDVTFTGGIGTGAADGVDLFSVVGSSTATLDDMDIYTEASGGTVAGLAVASGATLNIEADDGTVTVDEVAGDMDFDGTVSITGVENVAFDAASDIFIDGTFTTALSSAGDTTTLTGGNSTVVGGTSNTTVSIGNQLVLGGATTLGRDGGTNTFSVDANGTIDLDAASGVINGNGQTITFATGSVNNFTVASGSTGLTDGETIKFIDGAAGGSDIDGALDDGRIVLLDTALVNLEDASSDNADLTATVDILDASTVIGAGFGGAANAVTGDTTLTGALLAERGNLLGASSTADARAVAEKLAPTVDGGAQVGVVGTVTNSSLGVTGERMASLRSGDQQTGMAAGNMTHGLKTWGKVFGTTGEQDARDGVSGYDVDTWGLTVGMDTQTLAEDWVWGLAFTYADTEVDSANTANTEVELDTYQIALYGDYKWDAATYINGQIGYGMNNGDQTRTIAADAGGTTTASADTDSDVFFARLEAGRDYDMDNGWTLTPIALLNYQHINSDDYTEACAAASTACLSNVDVDSMNILEAGLAGEASYLHQMADGSFLKPKAHVSYRYDFIGDEVETTSSFSGQGTTFTTEGFDSQQHTVNVGAGLEFYTTSNWELSVNYDYEMKEDYDGHNGYVRAAYKF